MQVGSTLYEALQVAQKAAHAAGAAIHAQITSQVAHQRPGTPHEQARIRLIVAQAAITILRSHFPQHAIRCRGVESYASEALYTWRLDPLDGEGNIFLQIPHCAICLTLTEGAQPLLSVIFQPFLSATYTAVLDYGACANGVPVHVAPPTPPLKDSVVSLLLDHWTGDDYLALRFLTNLRAQTQRVLMNWAISLDWRQLASGATGGLVSLSGQSMLERPAMLAGTFYFQQAGGYVGDLTGRLVHDFSHKSVIAATTPARIEEIRRVIDRPLRPTAA
jgi:fructose-1,6-bisphosphatase/inositol monophosphatase family enzyme